MQYGPSYGLVDVERNGHGQCGTESHTLPTHLFDDYLAHNSYSFD